MPSLSEGYPRLLHSGLYAFKLTHFGRWSDHSQVGVFTHSLSTLFLIQKRKPDHPEKIKASMQGNQDPEIR